MKPAWHLPELGPLPQARREIDGTGVRVPVLDARQAERAWKQLDAAAEVWRRVPLPERIDRIARAASALRHQGPDDDAEMLARSAGLSLPGLAAAWDATFAPCTAASLAAAAAAEPQALAAPVRRVVHVLAGNVLPPTWSMLVRGLLLAFPQWLRPAAREPLFAPWTLQRLARIDAELAATAAILWWPHEDVVMEPTVVAGANVVTVQGDDASVAAVAARVRALSPDARVVGYGTRWSAAVVSRAAQTPASAAAVARDLTLFDGRGCLSPGFVLAEDGSQLHAWCSALAAALATEERRMPRGEIPAAGRAALRAWRQSVRLGQALGTHRALWESPASSAWAVALHTRCEWPWTPFDRHAAVVPFASLTEVTQALAPHLAHLQGLAVAWDDWDAGTRDAWRDALQPTRIAPLGTLQWAPPGWAQDHRPALASLAAIGFNRP